MIYFLLKYKDTFSALNLLQYITFRTFMAFMTSFLIYFFYGKKWIEFLKRRQFKQVIRVDGPQTHQIKQNTPTMGGVLLMFGFLMSGLLWCDLKSPFILSLLFLAIGFAFIGLIDDLRKIRKKNTDGFRGPYKIVLEVFLGLTFCVILFGWGYLDTTLSIPFAKNWRPDLGVGILVLGVLVCAGASNAVNLTDGLDGLMSVPSVFAFLSLGVVVYAAGHFQIANYLQVPFIAGSGEVAVLCGAMMGALVGFLWYNAHPAQIFMGDVGALGVGGLMGGVAIIAKAEILLIIIGGVFVLEAVSVILQVCSYKVFKKRIFKMAPLHHHFELLGLKESKVIVRFWILSFLFCLLSLVTLKIR